MFDLANCRKRQSDAIVVEVDISIRDGAIDGAGVDEVLASSSQDIYTEAELSAGTTCK